MGLFNWLKQTARADSVPSTWKVGDRVLAKWVDEFFYPGVVRGVSGKNCQVYFDDGDVAWVHCAHVLAPDIHVGSRVFSRIKGGPSYFPGTVEEQKGEAIHVRYESGDEEWTSISFVRVQRAIADVGDEVQVPGQPAPLKHTIDLGAPLLETDWRDGDRVLARWVDFYWYPGTILGMGEKGFHILYDDGDQRVVPQRNLMPLSVEEGETIFVRPRNEPQRIYTPATVTRVTGEKLDVEMEDGLTETNTKVSRARFWRCPVRISAFPFEEGERVLAFDADNCIYPAEIVSIEEDRVTVQYLDGPERMLTPELIRRFDLRPGTRVECRWKGGPNYFPGVLRQIEGDRVFIKYDDGDEERTSVRLLRLPSDAVHS